MARKRITTVILILKSLASLFEEDGDHNDDIKAVFEKEPAEDKEMQHVNVNNNYNITIPVKDLSKNSTKIGKDF